MSNSEFEPKIGKPRSGREIKAGRLTRMVVKATTRHRAPKSPWANALTRRPVAELGRGKGALYGLTPPPPGWRRVIVKARIARHATSDLAAARTHQHYIMRDCVTPDGGPGQLYDREHDVADGGDFLDRQKGDTYQSASSWRRRMGAAWPTSSPSCVTSCGTWRRTCARSSTESPSIISTLATRTPTSSSLATTTAARPW